jgi:hypothetical protein
MTNVLALIALAALLAAQLLAVVFAYQLRTDFSAVVATRPPVVTQIHPAA